MRLVAIMLVAMAIAALAVDGIFTAMGLVPETRPSIDSITARSIEWNYTTFLNIVFFGIAGVLFGLTMRRGARDPVCGMTVDRSKTPYRSEHAGRTFYFCSAACQARFDAAPERYVKAHSSTEPEKISTESTL